MEPLKFAWPVGVTGVVRESSVKNGKPVSFEYQISGKSVIDGFEVHLTRPKIIQGENLAIVIGGMAIDFRVQDRTDAAYMKNLGSVLRILGKESVLQLSPDGKLVGQPSLPQVTQTVEEMLKAGIKNESALQKQIEFIHSSIYQETLRAVSANFWGVQVEHWIDFSVSPGEKTSLRQKLDESDGAPDVEITLENLGPVTGRPELLYLRKTLAVDTQKEQLKAYLEQLPSYHLIDKDDIDIKSRQVFEVHTDPRTLQPHYSKTSIGLQFISKSGKSLPEDMVNPTSVVVEYRISW